jgi:two-component system, OmpR family, response regulator VicR
MKILIVEDSPEIVGAVQLCFQLGWPGTELLSTSLGKEGVVIVENSSPDVVIVDLGLPDTDGFEVVKEIRTFSDVPLLIVTARDDEMSKLKGLELGADDYIVKPFSPMELLARVRAILRRTNMPQLRSSQKVMTFGELCIDFAGREVTKHGRSLQLTPTEWKMLLELVRNEGKVLSYDTLLTRVWGDEYIGAVEYVKKYVYRLRQKLGDDPESPNMIVSARGMGYKFVKPNN